MDFEGKRQIENRTLLLISQEKHDESNCLVDLSGTQFQLPCSSDIPSALHALDQEFHIRKPQGYISKGYLELKCVQNYGSFEPVPN